MAGYNRVILIGNLTKDPEVRYTPKGTAVADLRMAVSRKNKDKDEVCFIDVVVWEKQAELCGEYLRKGSQFLVEGRLVLEEWENKEKQRVSRHRVVAERIQFLGSPKGPGSGAGRGPAEDAPPPSRDSGHFESDPPGDRMGADDDNLPF
jgi:single-strand DNA-binding protein